MFIEQNITGERRGWIEVICGSMFSGKTEELIRRLKRAKIANLKIEIYKPAADTRYDVTKIVSHDANAIASTQVANSAEILALAEHAQVVGIDEAQFFDEGIIAVCETLVMQGKRVIVAGLDMDYLGNPFGPMPALLSIAEYVTKVHAICVSCGNLAQFSYRFSDESGQVLVGAVERYKPLCRSCFNEALH
jgi:thymidine kinase